jgi:site-specific recombinase XerD
LSLLYNTGARAQEMCDLRVGDVRLESPPLVIITGKGRKKRAVPLWPDTAALLKTYMAERGLGGDPAQALFANARGGPLSRFGLRHIVSNRTSAAAGRCPSLAKKSVSPHTFRHTTAMHMLQSGVDLSVIKSWLGHVKLSTTHAYVEIDLEMKRKALSACAAIGSPESLRKFVDQNADVISWLESL